MIWKNAKELIKNIIGHFRNVIIHKYWVYHYGRKLNIDKWQLLKHDLSKFSPIEFKESVLYFKGESSPIPECKKCNGYSKAWQHHKGRNPHHYEYWTDNYDNGTTTIPMPYKYVMEMIADWMAAGRTYMGHSFTFAGQVDWWNRKKETLPKIHPLTIKLINEFFDPQLTEQDAFDFFNKCSHMIEMGYNDNFNDYKYTHGGF